MAALSVMEYLREIRLVTGLLDGWSYMLSHPHLLQAIWLVVSRSCLLQEIVVFMDSMDGDMDRDRDRVQGPVVVL